MRRISTLLVAGLCAGIFSFHTPAQAAAEMSLMRLADCGTPQAPVLINERFSDTFSAIFSRPRLDALWSGGQNRLRYLLSVYQRRLDGAHIPASVQCFARKEYGAFIDFS
jgi:hypothetical protein